MDVNNIKIDNGDTERILDLVGNYKKLEKIKKYTQLLSKINS